MGCLQQRPMMAVFGYGRRLKGGLYEQISPLMNGGYASLHQDGSYSLGADVPDSSLWWAVKLCRFSPGEIDRYDPRVRKVDS